MNLLELQIENFRGFQDETTIRFNELTVLIGKNDAGKSTILDALDVFFNDRPIEKDDVCVFSGSTDVKISCTFSDLPDKIIIDELATTSLKDEYLLNSEGNFKITRVYNCSAAKGKQSAIYAIALHPSATGYSDLLSLKNKDLKTRAKELSVDVTAINQTINSQIRSQIWLHSKDLELKESQVDLASETGKKVWEQIQLHLPVFAVFKSDRASTDQDEEAQDPMKSAIKEAIKAHESDLNLVIDKVKSELERVAKSTVEKIQEMSPELASQLNPIVKNKNWDSLFAVSLTGDNGIPINKRGSGTRRLVLLNFFRAKAEETSISRNTGIIYAVEEPETSQHPNHQTLLLNAFHELVEQGQCQIILTTHTPTLARKVSRDYLRLVTRIDGKPTIKNGSDEDTLEEIKNTLGVLADHDIKVFLGVEGKHDISFLQKISRILNASDSSVPDLEEAERNGSLVFIPLGGSSMDLWAVRLAGIERPEFFITDRDVQPPADPKYKKYLDAWNTRQNCKAWVTSKRELENYLHPDVIRSISPGFPATISDFDDVPYLVAQSNHNSDPTSKPWAEVNEEKRKQKMGVAKRRLNNECVSLMTPELLSVTDSKQEIVGWLKEIGTRLK
jgi:putative ATP-dependent endonuclease of the OLD family